MYYTKQDYYDQFRCIADKCPENCCSGWEIVIDDESLEKYVKQEGPMGNRLNNSIDFDEGTFIRYNRRCAMLNDNGLCDLQSELGEGALCKTCMKYPRHEEEFEGLRELSLSLSCPEVARLTVFKDKPFTYVEYEDELEDDFDDFDFLMFTKLEDARRIIFDIINSADVPLFERMQAILDFSRELQNYVDEDALFDMDECIDKWTDINLKAGKRKFQPTDLCKLNELEKLYPDWEEVLKTTENYVNQNKTKDFLLTISDNEERALTNVLTSLIFTYFCGAVYDDMIYSKSALCVQSVWWIYAIYKALLDKKGLKEDLDTLIWVIYRYAREVEHSDLNLDALEEMLM